MNTAEDLRRRRTAVTRDAIRDALVALLRDEHPATISIPAVAEAAGVSVRTVYRHFPSKQALLDDVAMIQRRRAESMLEGRGGLFDNPEEYLPTLWADFERDLGAVLAQHQSPAGHEVRAHRAATHRATLRPMLVDRFPDVPESDIDDLTDLAMLLTSSSAFLDLHLRLGRSGVDAARIAWWAVQAIQRQFAESGGLGRSSVSDRPAAAGPAPTSDFDAASDAAPDPDALPDTGGTR